MGTTPPTHACAVCFINLAAETKFEKGASDRNSPTVTAELERGLPNMYQPSTVSAELEWALPNVQYPSTVSAEVEWGLPNVQ